MPASTRPVAAPSSRSSRASTDRAGPEAQFLISLFAELSGLPARRSFDRADTTAGIAPDSASAAGLAKRE